MEIRKIQKTGGSTLVVSLPKAWCQNFDLKVGSKVMMNYSDKGGIIMEPFDRSQESSVATVDFKDTPGEENALRLLISRYIQGVKKIVVKADDNKFMDEIVRRFLDLTVGFEIVDERKGEVTMEDLISLPMLTFEKAMKRMATLVRSIVEESINPQKIPQEYILEKENEVDKFNIYIQRLFNQSLKDYSVLQLNKISSSEALSYLLTSRILERIADHGIRIYSLLGEKPLKNEEILRYVKNASDIMARSMEYYLKKDAGGANREISRKEYFKEERNQINRELRKTQDGVVLAEILEDGERIALYSTDICELVMDYSE